MIARWCRVEALPAFPVDTARPLYEASRNLRKLWLDFADVLLRDAQDADMLRAGTYLLEMAQGQLEIEGPLPMPWHTNPPSQTLLVLERLATVPKSTRQLLPVATFSCAIQGVRGFPVSHLRCPPRFPPSHFCPPPSERSLPFGLFCFPPSGCWFPPSSFRLPPSSFCLASSSFRCPPCDV